MLLFLFQYLHKQNITHRDLKPENILLATEDDITLIKVSHGLVLVESNTKFHVLQVSVSHSEIKFSLCTQTVFLDFGGQQMKPVMSLLLAKFS